METKTQLSNQWILLGSISGITATLVYLILLTITLPSFLEILLAGMFGILVSLSGYAIHYLVSKTAPNILTQIGANFIFVGGVILNLMLVIQLNFVGKLRHLRTLKDGDVDANILSLIGKAVDPVHLAFDVSWDFFLGIATILFAIMMYNSQFFGKLWALLGFILAVTLLAVEFSSFPFTPYDLGLPYVFGPSLSVWYLAVYIQCLRKRKVAPVIPLKSN